jgi:hypothetical protein
MQRQASQIVAVKRQGVKCVKLDRIIVPARVQPVKIRGAINAKQDRFAVYDEAVLLFFSAASTMGGKRSVQS